MAKSLFADRGGGRRLKGKELSKQRTFGRKKEKSRLVAKQEEREKAWNTQQGAQERTEEDMQRLWGAGLPINQKPTLLHSLDSILTGPTRGREKKGP